MTNYQLWDAIGHIDEALVMETKEYEKVKIQQKAETQKLIAAEKQKQNTIETQEQQNVHSIINLLEKRVVISRKFIPVAAVLLAAVISVGGIATYMHLDKLKQDEKAHEEMLAELEEYKLVDRENAPYIVCDKAHPDDVEEAMDWSELVVRCKVQCIGQPYYEAFVSDSVAQQMKENGRGEWEYSHMWTDCVLTIEEVYKGDCGEQITYRFLCNGMEKLEETTGYTTENGEEIAFVPNVGYELENGKEYVLFLRYDGETETYQNAISPWYVMEKR